ncbi:uncharacterized protein SAPINGB_P002041 [Magnusiomyces paraingens]|uniref:Uncharacterized protein n=1 Tax=Magnusiomyces paraingens TaxID=2606893 RepID=A0A5E8BHH6_9ASCO|nr:uncharacterized protein SAPINGB_P002041 [Saprochaete ingens]VVT48972.1 unnamed protein product [Saprochaete ingens]
MSATIQHHTQQPAPDPQEPTWAGTSDFNDSYTYYYSDSDPESPQLDASEFSAFTGPLAMSEELDHFSYNVGIRSESFLGRPLNEIIQRHSNSSEGETTERINFCFSKIDPLSLRTLIDDLKDIYHKEDIKIEVQPAFAYNSSLSLVFKGAQKLSTDSHPPFMNNIASASNLYPMVFIADRSSIKVHGWDGPTGVLEPVPVFQFDTRPAETTDLMREAANIPGQPHNITHMTLGFLRDNEREVLVAACDNGRALVWDTYDLYEKFKASLLFFRKKKQTPLSRDMIILKKLKPSVIYQLPKSAWGLAIHKRFNLLAVSCNEDTEPEDVSRGLYYKDAFYVMATSISGHVAMWEFFMNERLEVFSNLVQEKMDMINLIDANIISREVAREKQQYQTPSQQHPAHFHSHTQPAQRPRQTSLYTGNVGRRTQRNNSAISLSDLMEFISESPTLPAMQEEEEDFTDDDFEQAPPVEEEQPQVSLLEHWRTDFPTEDIDPLYLHIPFEGGRWMSIDQLKQDGWTIKGASERDFLQVGSLYELSGNQWYNDANIFKQQSSSIHKQYAIPGLNRKIKKEDGENTNSPGSHALGVNSDVIPLSQEFIDFAMRLSYFVIYTKAIQKFADTWDKCESDNEDEWAGEEDEDDPAAERVRRPRNVTFLNSAILRVVTPFERYIRNTSEITPTTGLPLDNNRSPQNTSPSQVLPTPPTTTNTTSTATTAPQSSSRVSRPVSPHSWSRRTSREEPTTFTTTTLSSAPSWGGFRQVSWWEDNSGEAGSGHQGHLDTYFDVHRKQHRDWYVMKRTAGDLASPFSQELLRKPPFDNKFVILTSKKSLHLCRAESLWCNAAQGDVFKRETYLMSSLSMYDRLSISVLLPGINAILVATPLGAISLMRLVAHKKVFSLRQEYVFPVHEMLSAQHEIHSQDMDYNDLVVTGVLAVPVYRSDQNPRTVNPHDITKYRITVTYRTGLALTFEASRNNGGNSILNDLFS